MIFIKYTSFEFISKEEEKICLIGYLRIKIRVNRLDLEPLFVNIVNTLVKDVIQDFVTLVIQTLEILVLSVEKQICKKKSLNSR